MNAGILRELNLKTTTRPNRHAAQLGALRTLLAPPADGRPLEVAELGPGLAVKYLGRLAEETVPGWDIVKRIESGIRRIPMPDACFENYEAHELVRALDGLPFRLTVIDINPKVVRIVRNSIADRPVEAVVADLGEERPASLAPLQGRFDLVVAFAVIARVDPRKIKNAAGNVTGLLRPGGLLLVDSVPAAAGCAPVAGHPGFYRRGVG